MIEKKQEGPNESKTPADLLVLALATLIANRRKTIAQQNQTGDKLATLLAAREKLSAIKSNGRQS